MKIAMVLCECIVRFPDETKPSQFRLHWVGQPADPMANAVERCNDGSATEIDYIALSAFPVFDAEIGDAKAGELLEIIGGE